MIPRNPQGPIQRAFTGLIGLFDLKGAEVAPNSMRGDVQPIIDVRQFVLAGNMRSMEGAGSTAFADFQFVGAGTPVRVPAGKVWVVQAATVFVTLPAAGDTVDQLWVSMRRSGAMFSQAYVLGQKEMNPVGSGVLAAAGFVGPLVVPAGWEFGIGASGVLLAAGPMPYSIGVIASEFDA